MGRKQKLRREKKANIKNNNEESILTSASAAVALPTLSATAPAFNSRSMIGTGTRSTTTTTAATRTSNTDRDEEDMALDNAFPKSEPYVQANQKLLKDGNNIEAIDRCIQGSIEHGCVHSMFMIGSIYSVLNDGKCQFWFLEGAIRGSGRCANNLVAIYSKSTIPRPPISLMSYWWKIYSKYAKWNGTSDRSGVKEFTETITRSCAMCSKKDTATLTLRQCSGCSIYCYCTQECQTNHWKKHNHKVECTQFQILTTYHKPYVKEIYRASIRGETHPALEKLRSKLGLSYLKKYAKLRQQHNNNIHEGNTNTNNRSS